MAGRRGPTSLRTRLILSAAYLLAAIILALELPLASSVQKTQVTSFQATELGYAGLLASRVSDPVAKLAHLSTEPTQPGPSITDAIAEIQAQFLKADLPQPRILIVDARYRVLADTSGEFVLGTVVSTAGRPELPTAIGGTIWAHARFSETVGQDLLIVAVPVFEGGNVVGAVRLSSTLGDVKEAVRSSWIGLGLVGLAALVIGLALAWVLATSLSRPVRRLEEVAGRLGSGDLQARAEVGGPAEVATLAGSFNRMADALTSSMVAQRDFVANASHQLRTPLTGLRLRLEAIQDGGGPAAEEAAKAEIEVDRMASLVEDLLTLARATEVEATRSPVDLGEAGRGAVDRWSDTASRSGKHLLLRTGHPATVWAAQEDVEHVLDNLIENAIRYCPRGTTITVETDGGPDGGMLAVADDGPGIPQEDRERIFERFYRGSAGRMTGPGTGLGLAIVRQLAVRWGGDARLADGSHASSGDGMPSEDGTRIEVTMPRSPAVP